MRQRQAQDADEGEMGEECCFVCKDSGHDLRVCDSRNCLKAYHPGCVGDKDEDGDRFICDWHICVQCRGRSDYQCLCCPLNSVCCACLRKVEFVQLRNKNKGFCSTCFNLVIAIEKNDLHVSKTDNYQILFKDYWEGIKDAENLTLVDLEEASDILNRKFNCKEGVNLDHKSDDNDASDRTIPLHPKGKQVKADTSQRKKSKQRTYVGWGSKQLIEFLSSFGKDTSKPLEKFEITEVVKGYIEEKKLYEDDEKLCFLCDDKLQPLFTRRKVRCKSIRRLLKYHLASNVVSEDERSCSSEDDDDATVVKKRPWNSLEPKIAKRVSERSKKTFASLTHSNINLIYLRKTLVVNLLSQPDTFEQKVVGCFVRVRCNKMVQSYEIAKKEYLLGQITGIKKSKNEYKIKDTCTDTLLCVTGLLEDVSISMLSDEDLPEDECDDLIVLAEKGLLKRTTVAELEEKVATVHKDIVNHWIEIEPVRLERKIDNAHIKGRHVEMEELLKRKKLLNTPAERQRRLEEVPEIVPDIEYEEKENELQVAASNSSQENRGATHQSVDSLNVLNGEPSKGRAKEQIHDCLNVLNKESSEVAFKQGDATHEVPSEGATEHIHGLNILVKGSSEALSKQGDATREEVDPGVDRSVVNSDGMEEKRDAEETLSVRTSPKRGAQSLSETSQPKKPRLSEECAPPEAKFADHPRPLRLSSPIDAIGSSPPPRQGPVLQEGEERAGEMLPTQEAKAVETGGSAPSPGAEDTDTAAGVPPPEPETGEPTVKRAPVVAPSAACLDSMDVEPVEARPSPRPWPVVEAGADVLELQEQVPATGANLGDGPPPEPWAEPTQTQVSSSSPTPRADETIVPAPELVSQETVVAATEFVSSPSSGPACLALSGPLLARPSSRALVRVPGPTDHELVGRDLDKEAELAALSVLAARLRESSAIKSQALREQHATLQSERRRSEELSAKLASTERALGVARREADDHREEARRTEQKAQRWSTELADVRQQLKDAQVQLHAALEDVDRLERERDSAAQAAETTRQAAVAESARQVAQLEELRRGKAASDAAAQESARRVEVLRREKLYVEAALENSERGKRVVGAELVGCRKLITRLEGQLSSSMEERSRLQAKLKGIQQLSAEVCDCTRKDGSVVMTRQLQQAAAEACNCIGKDGVRTRAMTRAMCRH